MQLGLRKETFTQGDLTWLGSAHGTENARTATIVTSTLTANTHFPEGFLLSGLPLAKYTGGPNLGRYTAYATGGANGAGTLVGFLLYAVPVPDPTVDTIGALLDHGRIVTTKLPIAVDAAGQAAVAGRIWFV